MASKHTFSRKIKALKLRWPVSKLFSFQATVWLLGEIKNAASIDIQCIIYPHKLHHTWTETSFSPDSHPSRSTHQANSLEKER